MSDGVVVPRTRSPPLSSIVGRVHASPFVVAFTVGSQNR